ncbi:Asp23/Gls24 family envelope stress response protein [Streptomyces sp. SID10853]|uniref:Asp23/Gls24 family envelope stress response protein n=1 Tax=Streptomyces sp. SID10853 TaxID=2706028 RepID=UPI001EF2B66E|nr:Asp23/Gls24 family envelope stress response protein [Streptomyces sp. SID10853]
MTDQDTRAQLSATVAEAALGVPGVAFLRPGLAGLLRTAGRSGPAGVRIGRAGGADSHDSWTAEVFVVLRRGHRAVDVTRAVRAAVLRAVTDPAAVTVGVVAAVTVGVTVTGFA